MEENGKFLRLFGRIGLTGLIFFIALFATIYLLRMIFGVLDFMPWFSMFYTLLIVFVPAFIFVTVFVIYFYQSKRHISKNVRLFSNIIFSVMLTAWACCLITDLITFFKSHYRDIAHYNSYNLAFLAANVGVIFFVGILQALTSSKEVDWMDRNKT